MTLRNSGRGQERCRDVRGHGGLRSNDPSAANAAPPPSGAIGQVRRMFGRLATSRRSVVGWTYRWSTSATRSSSAVTVVYHAAAQPGLVVSPARVTDTGPGSRISRRPNVAVVWIDARQGEQWTGPLDRATPVRGRRARCLGAGRLHTRWSGPVVERRTAGSADGAGNASAWRHQA